MARTIADSITADSPSDVGLFVPLVFLETVKEIVGDKLIVGAEMVTPEVNGAFTGGVSPGMLKSLGIEWALAGHSERRTLNGETDEYINAQCKLLVENDMNVILCIGETLEEFEKSLVDAICEVQLKKGLADIGADQMSAVTIAYEPVWAIGTGLVCSSEDASKYTILFSSRLVSSRCTMYFNFIYPLSPDRNQSNSNTSSFYFLSLLTISSSQFNLI